MLKTSEIAKRSGVTADTIRHYTQTGLLQPGHNPKNGYKLYSVADVKLVRFIIQAKCLGFTLKEVGQIVQNARQGQSPCPQVRNIIAARIRENRQRLDALNALQGRMEKAVDKWKALPDGVPDGDSICHLIEGAMKDGDNDLP